MEVKLHKLNIAFLSVKVLTLDYLELGQEYLAALLPVFDLTLGIKMEGPNGSIQAGTFLKPLREDRLGSELQATDN